MNLKSTYMEPQEIITGRPTNSDAMSKRKTVFALYDSRYFGNSFSATLYEHCDTLTEARTDKREIFPDAVIVMQVLQEQPDGTFTAIQSVIIL